MPSWTIYNALGRIALAEFDDIVVGVTVLALPTGDPLKLRLDIVDGSLLDVFLSASSRYSYHWERRLTTAAAVYRHDNAPHVRWRDVVSFPKHFHDGAEDRVTASQISEDPREAIREFLTFVRQKLLNEA
jgi:hypothetical protein